MLQGLDAVKAHAVELSAQYDYAVEVREHDRQIYVILSDVDLPEGVYNMVKTDVLFFTDQQYPLSVPDMFWVNKGLLLAGGGQPKSADQFTTHLDNVVWRRFSWHPNISHINSNANGLIQHFELILERWRRELQP